MESMSLEKLFGIIKSRAREKPKGSYVASLFAKGKDSIVQKVGEEAVEVVIASKNKNKKALISELADLWFHALVLMVSLNISPGDIEKELERRHKSESG